MNTGLLKYIVPPVLVVASAVAGYFMFRPHPSESDHVAEVFAKKTGIDQSLMKQAMPVFNKASMMKTPSLSSADLAILWRMVDTKNKPAMMPTLMAVSNGCPQKSVDECYSHLEPVALSFPDEAVELHTYETLWDLKPQNRAHLREDASSSAYSRVRKEVPKWPDELTETNH